MGATKLGIFISRYWKIIALAGLISGALWGVYLLYEDNKSLAADVVLFEDRYERCRELRDDFSDKLNNITEVLQQVESSRGRLEDDIEEANDEITRIQNERNLLLQEVRNLEIPETCDDQLDWLVDRFQDTQRRFYENNE